jgi:inorganic triphosphatase YgiF
MSLETELKLELHPQDLPRLLAHPLLTKQAPRRERLLNTYFDTSTLALRAQRMAVRERRVNGRPPRGPARSISRRSWTTRHWPSN